jgi:hypothetical protein
MTTRWVVEGPYTLSDFERETLAVLIIEEKPFPLLTSHQKAAARRAVGRLQAERVALYGEKPSK